MIQSILPCSPPSRAALWQRYFRGWLRAVRGRHSADTLNYYERNVEVWRQLWRVLEQSDVVAVVGDARSHLHHPCSALPVPQQYPEILFGVDHLTFGAIFSQPALCAALFLL